MDMAEDLAARVGAFLQTAIEHEQRLRFDYPEQPRRGSRERKFRDIVVQNTIYWSWPDQNPGV